MSTPLGSFVNTGSTVLCLVYQCTVENKRLLWVHFDLPHTIAGNFWMVQIFAYMYFKHIQIMWKVEPTKIFFWDYEITQFLLTQQLFVYYGAPDIPVSITLMMKKHATWVKRVELAHVSRGMCGLKNMENSKIRTLKFYSNGKFEIIRKHAPTKITHYTVPNKLYLDVAYTVIWELFTLRSCVRLSCKTIFILYHKAITYNILVSHPPESHLSMRAGGYYYYYF